jgi:hypothetical protein
MPSKRSTLFEESKGMFSSESLDEGEDDGFLMPPTVAHGHRHSSMSGSSGTNKGSKWFSVPRFDNIYNGSMEKPNRRVRSDNENKEGEVYPHILKTDNFAAD